MCSDLLGERRPVQPAHCRSTLSLPRAAGYRDDSDCVSAAPHLNTSRPHQLPPAKVSTRLSKLIGFDVVCTYLGRPLSLAIHCQRLVLNKSMMFELAPAGIHVCCAMCKQMAPRAGTNARMLVSKLADFGREHAGSHHACSDVKNKISYGLSISGFFCFIMPNKSIYEAIRT